MKLFFNVVSTILISLPTFISGDTDFTIRIDGGVINCGGLICPADSESCAVSEVTSPDLSKIEITKQCFDATGTATTSDKLAITNPYPGTVINNISKVHINGATTTNGSSLIQPIIDLELRAQKLASNFLGRLFPRLPFGFQFK